MPTEEVDLTAMTPDQAQAQLNEASTRGKLARTDSGVGARYTAVLGVVIAALLTVVALLRGNPVGLAVSIGGYMAVIGALVGWERRRFRVAPRGWGRRYLWGFGVTMALYTGGIFWESLAFPGWGLFAPYCVLVAVPSLIAATVMVRSGPGASAAGTTRTER